MCLTVRDLSERTLSTLKDRARSNRRSLNGEILYIFDWVVEHGVSDAIPTAGMIDPAVARQKAACEQLIGSWDDDRSAEEIIADITSNRTMGREVSL